MPVRGLTPKIATELLEKGRFSPKEWADAGVTSFASLLSMCYQLYPHVRQVGKGKSAVFFPVNRPALEDISRKIKSGKDNDSKTYDFYPLLIQWGIHGAEEWKGRSAIYNRFTLGKRREADIED